MIGRAFAGFLGLMALTIGAAQAQCTGLPYTFASGTTISAAQMNANFSYIMGCLANTATLGANTFTGAQTLPGNPTSALQAATKQYVDTAAGGGGDGVSVRQTVAAGPVTTAGLPNFLPATSGSLSLTSLNINSTTPLAATAANNASPTSGAAQDVTGVSTSNLTWSGLTASTTNYLYITISSGALTTGSTTLAPIYQFGGTPSTTNGQFTFNIGEMRGYLGNGSSAPQTSAVFVGEAVTNSSAVTNTVAYAYNGQYDSGFTPTLPTTNAPISANHNIGVYPQLTGLIFECTTADNGYAVGDRINGSSLITANGIPNYYTHTLWSTNKAIGTVSSSLLAWGIANKTTGVLGPLTLTSWKYKFVATRGW
jgi:hypothetical protein